VSPSDLVSDPRNEATILRCAITTLSAGRLGDRGVALLSGGDPLGGLAAGRHLAGVVAAAGRSEDAPQAGSAWV
jgi:hypothetical protein